MRRHEPATAQLAAGGVLPFFDNGKTILLGQEFRERDNNFAWMEFGGKQDKNETFAEIVCREANEPSRNGSETLQHHVHATGKTQKPGVFQEVGLITSKGTVNSNGSNAPH